ncbi:TPA: hypothetical protein OXC04_003747 [Escherichia coli]|nr:hypothetical protein [Escherichia coli]HDL0287141.1 hypothetical protein [Escherichia coli]
MALPKRLFYSLRDAASYLTANSNKCSVDDLLHFADIGMLEICTHISGRWRAEIDLFNHYETKSTDKYVLFKPLGDSLCQLPFTVYTPYSAGDFELTTAILFISEERPRGIPKNQIPLMGYRYLTIEGLMSICNLTKSMPFYDFVKYGKSSARFSLGKPRTMNTDGDDYSLSPMITFDSSPLDVSIDDLFITAEEIEILKDGGRDCANGMLMGCITKKLPSPTTQPDPRSALPAFVDDLLYLYYKDETKRGKPWLHVREDKTKGQPTELENDFCKAGLSLPSQKTMRRWFKVD